MMANAMLRVDGVVVFWSLGEWTDLDRLNDGLETAGYLSFGPEKRSPGLALKDAIQAMFPRHLIQPLKHRDQWEVRDIIRGEDQNRYPLKHVITYKEDTGSITMYPFDQEAATTLASEFTRYMGLVRAATVTATLTGVLRHLKGISLRGRGSVYWLPGDAIEQWQSVCTAVEQASVSGSTNACYMIRHAMDADALRAVKDAIVSEVQTECARIEAEIQGGELGERALRTRQDQAIDLRDKVSLFEDILGIGLQSLQGKVEALETAASQAAIIASLSAVGV